MDVWSDPVDIFPNFSVSQSASSLLDCVNICLNDGTCEAVHFFEPVFSTIPEFSTQSPFGEGGIEGGFGEGGFGGGGTDNCDLFLAEDLAEITQIFPDQFGGTFATKQANTALISELMGFGPDTVLPAEDVPECKHFSSFKISTDFV